MANELTRRTNSLFDMTPFNFFEDFGRNFFDGFKTNMVKTDIRETADEYLVEAEVPGIPKENLNVRYEHGVLTIEGQYQSDHESTNQKGELIRSERSFNQIRRQFFIEDIKNDAIKANYEDGILKVTLPKAKEKITQSKQIPIE